MKPFDPADHPRGDGGRFKTKARTEPEGGLADPPNVVKPDGTQEWFVAGRRHRVGGPAVSRADGTQEWWRDNWLHRTDGPAILWADGTEAWWQNNKLHRTDGPAFTWPDGSMQWWENDQRKPPEVEAMLTMVWLARTPNKA